MEHKEKVVRILLIDDRDDDVEKLKKHLNSHMRLPWDLVHCVSMKEASARIKSVDIIILELELQGLPSPLQVFNEIDDLVFEVPIIALTAEGGNGHGLATYVMEKGAADTIIRGQFERLIDAIEFALIRQKIVTDSRKANDITASDKKRLADDRLHESQRQREVDLEKNKAAREDDKEESRQTLRMFMGDYSVDDNQKK